MIMKTGQHLFTKDGRIVGNAIITEVLPDSRVRVETDFGNGGSILNEREINDWWHVTDKEGRERISGIEVWRREREFARTERANQTD